MSGLSKSVSLAGKSGIQRPFENFVTHHPPPVEKICRLIRSSTTRGSGTSVFSLVLAKYTTVYILPRSWPGGWGRKRGGVRGTSITARSEMLDGKLVRSPEKMAQFIFVLLLVGVMVVSYAGGVYFVKILRTNSL